MIQVSQSANGRFGQASHQVPRSHHAAHFRSCLVLQIFPLVWSAADPLHPAKPAWHGPVAIQKKPLHFDPLLYCLFRDAFWADIRRC
jgi:hypothetical protein